MAGSSPPPSDASSFAPPPGGDEPQGSPAERAQQRLLRPLGSLYALAQAITSTEAEARRLVEATYERAYGTPPDAQGADERRWLLGLLIETAREGFATGATPGEARFGAEREAERFALVDASEQAPAPEEPAGTRHLRQRARERFLRRALPAAFLALGAGQRLLLVLCDIEQLSPTDAASVTELDEDGVRQRLQRARAELRRTLGQMASRPERALLGEDFSARVLQAALRQLADDDLAAPPPALRPAIREAMRHPHASAPPSGPAARPPEAPAGEASEADSGISPGKRLVRRVLVAVLIIGVAGSVGYFSSAFLEDAPETDLLTLSATQAGEVKPTLRTENPQRAEQYVREALERRIEVPRIEGATLDGVGVAAGPAGGEVPVLLYRDAASGRSIPTYVYNYALLNRSGGGLTLPTDLLRGLEQEDHFAQRDVDDHRVLLWRHRDDIFAAVTSGRADSLQQRIAF